MWMLAVRSDSIMSAHSCARATTTSQSNFPAAKQKKKPTIHFELSFPAPIRDQPAGVRINEWLTRLSVSDREHVLTLHNPWATSILRQMLAWKLKDGEVVFKPIGNESGAAGSRLEAFFEPLQPREPHTDFDIDFEQNLRLRDSVNYLDTLCFSFSLLSDPQRFLDLAGKITAFSAFTYPCCVLWDEVSKTWLWECPNWTRGKTLTLSQFALALVEQQCWMRYFELTKSDPRASRELSTYIAPKNKMNNLAFMDIPSIIAYWSELDADKHYELAGDMKNLLEIFEQETGTFEKNQQTSFEIASLESCHTASFLSMCTNYSLYYSGLRSRMQLFTIRASVDLIRKGQANMSAQDFAEFLVKTPLERSGTVFDYIARHIARNIQERAKEQIVAELLLDKDLTQISTQSTRKKGKKKDKKAANTASTSGSPCIRPGPAPSVPETEETAQEVASEALDCILRQVMAHIETSEFEIVATSTRKKPKKKRKKKRKENTESAREPATLVPRPAQKPISSPPDAIVKWPEESRVAFKQICDFPPLHSQPMLTPIAALTLEIEQITQQITCEIGRKSSVITAILAKLQGVINFVFPRARVSTFGSYASGLAIPTSDLDIAVLGVEVRDMGGVIKTLEEVFQGFLWVATANGIVTASMPILKLEVAMQYFEPGVCELLHVDISFEDRTAGVHRGVATCAWVQSHLSAFPQTRACVLVLKRLLQAQDLNSAYYGGLSSYSLLLWTAAFVRTYSELTPGELLQSFLQFYGEEFNPRTTAVDNSDSGERFVPRSEFTSYCETLDPLREGNNTTKGAFRISEVQEVFRKVLTHLRNSASQNPLTTLLASPGLIKT